jgi:hypothetical protein
MGGNYQNLFKLKKLERRVGRGKKNGKKAY